MKRLIRNYNLSDAELATFANNLVTFFTRDATEFAERGVDSTAITAYQTLVDAFLTYPPDGYYLAMVKGEVDNKNSLREDSMQHIQMISGFFEQKWGLKDWHYDKLRIKNAHKFIDDKFLLTCYNVIAVAEEHLLDLTDMGLTQSDIDAFTLVADAFKDSLKEIENKKDLRDRKAYERIMKGNELYEYVSKYCTIGKLIWENEDESKYNDYVIYPKVTHSLGKVLNLTAEYSATPTPAITLAWDAVADATKYAVYQSTVPLGDPPDVWVFINDFTGTGETFDVLENTRYWWYVQAKNDTETGPPSDEVYADTVEE